MKYRVCGVMICTVFGVALSAQTQTGEQMYQASCAQCHDAGVGRAPKRDSFRDMSPERVLAAMETGEMITMGMRWPADGRRAIAQFLTGKTFGNPLITTPGPQAMCSAAGNAQTFNPAAGPAWNGWGVNTSNTRFQDAATAGLTSAEVPRL